ncbi:MAG: serine/threonine protein kinase [Ktedonobacteraceae bacterium]|nr:serine/threonine protein kinase [Ktedonobacteraceae bacterium]
MLHTGQSRDGGCFISHYSGPSRSQTGQLDRRTLLHKRYVILRTIGRGGMGAVYLAKDMKRQGAICAIKEMSLSMVPPEEQAQAIQNFRVEAKILWGLNHPNLPAFTGFFTENQRYFLVMEYIDGMTLEELLERNGGPFSERRVLGWARQLCDVLEYLHSQNPPIIFRDMKPGNIMLTRAGHIKLIDFGIARFFRPTGTQDTQHLGTPGFAPPEQYGEAQTDERSDIYSLGMTLFQLLTNTLSEQHFGLKDVRSFNSNVSPVVARALEKATSYHAEDRYDSVAEFRAAVLGVGFVFDSGELAMNLQELADLCMRYPDEAADYLAAGEIEAWLHELGEIRLARETQRIRTLIDNPDEAVDLFLQAALGQNPRVQMLSGNRASQNAGSSKGLSNWPRPSSSVRVSPRILDFDHIYPSISAPLTLSISGQQGLLVSGSVYSTESWIMLDQSHFDGMNTTINVRINSTKLRGGMHYTGTIVISPNTNGAKKDLLVTVEADVLHAKNNGSRHLGGKTRGADLNEELDDEEYDEHDALTMGAATLTPQAGQALQMARQVNGKAGAAVDQAEKFTPSQLRNQESRAKYGSPGNNGWEMLQVSPRQRQWIHRGLTFTTSLMATSLWYMLLSQAGASSLPPNPWFIIVLIGIIPTSAIGALLTSWSRAWSLRETLDRIFSAMNCTLAVTALARLLWEIIQLADLPALQLILLLFLAAASATFGSTPTVSSWLLKRVRRLLPFLTNKVALTCAALLGGILGGCLTAGIAFNWLTPIGILVGAGIIMGLEWHVAQGMQRARPPQQEDTTQL